MINHAFLHSPKMQNCSFPVVPHRGTADTVMTSSETIHVSVKLLTIAFVLDIYLSMASIA